MCGSVLSLGGCGVSVCDSVLKPSSGLVGPCVTFAGLGIQNVTCAYAWR